MHSIFIAFGPKKMLEIYTPSVNGDIGQANFENDNNLWLLGCL